MSTFQPDISSINPVYTSTKALTYKTNDIWMELQHNQDKQKATSTGEGGMWPIPHSRGL